MLDILKLNEKHIGRYVTYTPFDDCDKSLIEQGVITSWNQRIIFVRYGNDTNSKATSPSDLNFSIGGY